MTNACAYCRGPVSDAGLKGRPWPGRSARTYCCFGCLSLGEEQARQECSGHCAVRQERGPILRVGIGLLIVGQMMALSLAVNLTPPEEPTRTILHAGILTSVLVVVALLGWPLFRAAWTEARSGRVTIEALFLLTMIGAMTASLQSFITGKGPIYFEVVAVLLVVYTLGKMIGARGRSRALAAAASWANAFETCRLVNGNEVEVATIRPGDRVEVRPGESIAVDGVIREGEGFVSEASLTGEPYPVVKRPGDMVRAGTASHDATFRIEATTRGTERELDQLVQIVAEARNRPTSMQARADRLSRVFVPAVAMVALGTFAYWSGHDGWQVGLFNAMSVLLVACPCALGLATPVVMWSALSRLAERGVIVRNGDAIERLAGVNHVLFDKTGTLTQESFTLADVATLAVGAERATILGWLGLVQEHSSHPIAKPFAALPKPTGREATIVRTMTVVPGQGIEAELDTETGRHRLRIGRSEWIAGTNADHLVEQLLTTDGHRVDCEIDGTLAAIAIVREQWRDTSSDAIAELQEAELGVEVISGDPDAAIEFAKFQAGLTPEAKRKYIVALRERGKQTLMVGDGVNDAAALSEAYIGMALASGTDLANASADVTLYGGDLRSIPWAIGLARDVDTAIRRNLTRAAGYNVVGVTIAALGLLHPVTAALLMVASSMALIWSASRIGNRTTLKRICHPDQAPIRSWNGLRATVHGTSIAGQGLIIAALLNVSAVLLIPATLLGLGSAWVWHRWRSIPPRVDMTFGMLSVGCCGMLLGWWVDVGFQALPEGGCDHCTAILRGEGGHWMWLGMFIPGNLAMVALSRRPCSDDPTAMFVGGNVGMAVGMLLGGVWASSPVTALVGMTGGMTLGMLLGHELADRAIRGQLWETIPEHLARSESTTRLSKITMPESPSHEGMIVR